MTLEQLRAAVVKIVSEQLGLEEKDVKFNENWEAHGADSLDRVELVMAIEDEFGVEIDDDTAEDKLLTPESVVVHIAGLRNIPIPAEIVLDRPVV